jgi:hypothetical protein
MVAKTRKNNSNWHKLVMDIYKNRSKNCPHRANLKKVLKAASSAYCTIDEDIKDAEKHGVKVAKRKLPKYGTSETAWLHLVKDIMRNENCKHHHQLKGVLRDAKRVYCKNPVDEPKSSSTKKRRTRKASKSPILSALGLA